jgi:hypothetical protein
VSQLEYAPPDFFRDELSADNFLDKLLPRLDESVSDAVAESRAEKGQGFATKTEKAISMLSER